MGWGKSILGEAYYGLDFDFMFSQKAYAELVGEEVGKNNNKQTNKQTKSKNVPKEPPVCL